MHVLAAAHGQLDSSWPWFFSVAVVAVWVLAVAGAAALLLRRSVARRDRRRAHRRLGVELRAGEGDRALPPGG